MYLSRVAQWMIMCAYMLLVLGCGTTSNAGVTQLQPTAISTPGFGPQVLATRISATSSPSLVAVQSMTSVPLPTATPHTAPTATVLSDNTTSPSEVQPQVGLLWTFTADRAPCSAVHVAGDLVYGICGVADTFSTDADSAQKPVLFALDRQTGKARWQEPANWFVLGAGLVYIPCESNRAICAMEAQSGQRRWQQSVQYGFSTSVTEVDGVAYIGGGMTEGAVDPHVTAVDAKTGRPIWQFSTGDGAPISLAVVEQHIYITTSNQQIHALNRDSGMLLWSAASAVREHNLVIDDDIVYSLGPNDTLVALDRATGQPQWQLPMQFPDAYRVSMQALGNRLYIWGTAGKLWAIDLQHRELLWEDDFGAGSDSDVLARPEIASSVEYRGSAEGTIVAVSGTQPNPFGDPTHLSIGKVANGGNLRRTARIEVANVLGQVCPGDQVIVLQREFAQNHVWHRVRVAALGVDCDPQRVVRDSVGWLSSTLVVPVQAIVDS